MGYTVRHDSLGYWLWGRSDLFRQSMARVIDVEVSKLKRLPAFDIFFQIVTGHHGQPPKASQGLQDLYTLEDEQAAAEFAVAAAELLLTEPDRELLQDRQLRHSLRDASWQLAGLAVLADWLGSDRGYFSYCATPLTLSEYWHERALPIAEQALSKTPLASLGVQPFESIQQLFPYIQSPTPLQRFAVEHHLSDGPQLLILEDVTGAGKTEASMVLAHRLIAGGLADGLYVGLPTMATANAMYERVSRCYRQLFLPGTKPSLVLSHGSRHLSDAFAASVDRFFRDDSFRDDFRDDTLIGPQARDSDYAPDEPSASAYCNAWIADSRKRALFADVGVGTIDQALLAVLPVRHQSLRLLGLNRKVLLVDEVHAYDPYMTGLLQSLLELHARQGGSAILLSATLPSRMKSGLLQAFAKGLDIEPPKLKSADYPLITHFPANAEQVEYPVATRKTVARSVEVKALTDEEQVMATIGAALAEGKSVCWIRNTVDDARKSFKRCADELDMDPERIHLFHSRFVMKDRLRIEGQVLGWFGEGSNEAGRRARLLISTQVVEQSLDLDFDLLISDLAPVDLLIQRAGRLHRHIRDERGNRLPAGNEDKRGGAIFYLHTPLPEMEVGRDWLKNLSGTQAVYRDPGMLWRSAYMVLKNGRFRMPDDARNLIESVYGDETGLNTPEALLEDSLDADGERRAERSMANFNRLELSRGYSQDSNAQGWSEEVNVPTRLSEVTFSVVLVVPDGQGGWRPCAGDERHGWDLSVVTLREKLWRQAEKAIPAPLAGQLETLRETHPALRWHRLFPLTEELAGAYDSEQGWIGLG